VFELYLAQIAPYRWLRPAGAAEIKIKSESRDFDKEIP